MLNSNNLLKRQFLMNSNYVLCKISVVKYSYRNVTQTRFQWYRGRRVPFSGFALPDSFSAVPRASGPVYMFFAPGLVFGGTDGLGSHFHVLRARTRFRWYGGIRVTFWCFARPDSFSAVPRASGSFFMFFAPGLVFGGTEGVRFRFHVLAHGLVFGCTEGVGSRFNVLRARTRFRRYRGRRIPFSSFALLDSFLAVRRASGPVFMFCTPGLIFGGTEGVGFYFHNLRARTHFRRAVPRASGPVLMFCAFGLIFGGVECVGSRFHFLCACSRFQLYRRRGVPFSCFARPDSFSAVRRDSGPVLMFCAPGLVFGGTVGVGSRFHVLRS
jgi:hypothetical protein